MAGVGEKGMGKNEKGVANFATPFDTYTIPNV